MSLVPVTVTRFVGKQLFNAQQHSPQLLFAGGVAGVVGTVVLACKATLKLEEILDKHEDRVEYIKDDVARGLLPEEQYEKEIRVNQARTAITLVKIYAPAAGTGILSIGMLTQSHRILSNRNAVLTAAYSALHTAMEEYRSRVRTEVGEEKERELMFGTSSRTLAVDTKHGPKAVEVTSHGKERSPYSRIFDETNPNWQPDGEINLVFLRGVEKFMNQKLHNTGWVLLNEVFSALGFEETSTGAVCGWTVDGPNGFITFGLDWDSERAQDFIRGEDHSVLLEFNCQGEMWRAIDESQRRRYF